MKLAAAFRRLFRQNRFEPPAKASTPKTLDEIFIENMCDGDREARLEIMRQTGGWITMFSGREHYTVGDMIQAHGIAPTTFREAPRGVPVMAFGGVHCYPESGAR